MSKNIPNKQDFLDLYKRTYPRKRGGQVGAQRLAHRLRTWDEFERFKQAITNYKKRCVEDRTATCYMLYFSSFVGTPNLGEPWLDYVDDTKDENLQHQDLQIVEPGVTIPKWVDK